MSWIYAYGTARFAQNEANRAGIWLAPQRSRFCHYTFALGSRVLGLLSSFIYRYNFLVSSWNSPPSPISPITSSISELIALVHEWGRPFCFFLDRKRNTR